jgi:hypothetical protein
VVNFIADASTVYKTAFKNETVDRTYDDDFFEKSEAVDALRLKEVDAFLSVCSESTGGREPCTDYL